MGDRDENGRFAKGSSGNPNGRAPKGREERYYEILMSAVTFDVWEQIVKKAAEQAKKGDAMARKWLADYIVGSPIQRQEITGKDGSPIQIIEVALPPENE
jgi:hypothetical protein